MELFIVFALFFGSIICIFLAAKSILNIKERKDETRKQYDAMFSGKLKHIDGLQLACGVTVDVFYGDNYITIKKDKQEFSLSYDKIVDIDCVTGKDIKSQQATGAIAGKMVLGGSAGAIIGALASTTTYLVISYKSNGEYKCLIFDTYVSGTFALKVVKNFKKSNENKQVENIEL